MDSEALEFLAELEREAEQITSNDEIVPPGERECPICKEPMQVEFETGVHVDVCPEHGIWLDRGELPSILSVIRSGDRVNRHDAIRKARQEGKVSGTLFGAWSLLLD